MATGTTLVKLLDMLRTECRISPNPAHNRQQRDPQIALLQRTQEWFWDDFAWPHLRVDRYIDVQAGQRYYDLAAAKDAQGNIRGDLDIRRINHGEFRFGTVYGRMQWGIDARQYATFDSDMGSTNWPVSRWQITEDEQLEVWPVPAQTYDPATLDGRIKVVGIRQLKPFVADGDRADIDDQLLVLHAAAEYLAGKGSADAQVKQDKANARYLKLRGQLMPNRVHRLFGRETTRYVSPRLVGVYNKQP